MRLFLPKTAHATPVPVVLEYIPYRRRDGTRLGDEGMHRWFAANGYACARVDIAGMGDSDGLVEDEYALREQDDALEVVAWLAAQPWSSGAVGIIGISWGGFNGLQIAARRPPALKAVISLCSTVDRYHGDVHFTGGCLNEENLEWGGYFFTMNGFPPDPAIVGEDRWRELWRHRVEGPVLTEPLHLAGRPYARLRVSADGPDALVAVRLCAVHPDGRSERLSYGVLNLTHHRSHAAPEALVPGETYDVEVELKGIAQTVPPGHHLRVAISTSHWPMIWPSPRAATVTVHEDASMIDLPVHATVEPLAVDVFGPPEDARTGPVTVVRPGSETRHIVYDLGERRTDVIASRDDGVYLLDDIGTEQSFTRVRTVSVVDDEPLSARATVACRATYRRGDWDVRVETDLTMTCDEDTFRIDARLATFERGEVFVERQFERVIRRDHV